MNQNDRRNFVIVWKSKIHGICCNKWLCNSTSELRKQENAFSITFWCPFSSRTSICDSLRDTQYDNRKDEYIATLRDCRGRQFGCIKNCSTCIVLLVQQACNEPNETSYYNVH